MFKLFNRVKPYLDMNASDFESAIRNYKDAVIIDVRTPDEFNIGRIPGAINMDITRGDFESWVEDLDKDNTYLIYCRGGNRSIAACMIFGKKGLRSCNLAGGIYSWNGEIEGSV